MSRARRRGRPDKSENTVTWFISFIPVNAGRLHSGDAIGRGESDATRDRVWLHGNVRVEVLIVQLKTWQERSGEIRMRNKTKPEKSQHIHALLFLSVFFFFIF